MWPCRIYYVKASEETATMIELIQALLAKNLAYVRDGWVYLPRHGGS